MKICSKCNIEKDLKFFYKSKDKKDGYRSSCKDCDFLTKNKYYNDNKKILLEKQKEYSIKNKDRISEYRKRYASLNKERLSANHAEYIKYKIANDSTFRFKKNTRNLVSNSFKRQNFSKNSRTFQIIGCSFEEFKAHIENQFEPWMTWENHGKYNGELNFGWDIDHIIPIKIAKTEEEIEKLNHYTNLQPLCSKVNRVLKRSN